MNGFDADHSVRYALRLLAAQAHASGREQILVSDVEHVIEALEQEERDREERWRDGRR